MRTRHGAVMSVLLCGFVIGVGAVIGLSGAARSDASGQPIGTPCASPLASPAAVASPSASPSAVACAQSGLPDGALTNVTIEMSEFAFSPSSFTIPANTDIVVTVTNSGVLPHNFALDAAGIRLPDVPIGTSTEFTLNLPPGTYPFTCTVRGHVAYGMKGTLVVE